MFQQLIENEEVVKLKGSALQAVARKTGKPPDFNQLICEDHLPKVQRVFRAWPTSGKPLYLLYLTPMELGAASLLRFVDLC